MADPAVREVVFSNISSWTGGMNDTSFPGKAHDHSYIEKFVTAREAIVGVCEHRLHGRQVDMVQGKMRRHGIMAILHPADSEPDRGVELTGGVGLLASRHLQLEPLPEDLYGILEPEGLMRHRFGGARLRCRGVYINFLVA